MSASRCIAWAATPTWPSEDPSALSARRCASPSWPSSKQARKANGLSTATLKQHMAAIRTVFNHLVTGSMLEHNPALSVNEKLGKGKTPVLTAEEAGELLRSIETNNVVGLRDRALIGVMVFTFARIAAA